FYFFGFLIMSKWSIIASLPFDLPTAALIDFLSLEISEHFSISLISHFQTSLKALVVKPSSVSSPNQLLTEELFSGHLI
ncbi:MAG: hypothetical protein ABFS05_13370, partial [Bacteroidota bacterium]